MKVKSEMIVTRPDGTGLNTGLEPAYILPIFEERSGYPKANKGDDDET